MARPSKVPKPLQPMLATLIAAPFDDPAWVFESKWDGFRKQAIAKAVTRTAPLNEEITGNVHSNPLGNGQ